MAGELFFETSAASTGLCAARLGCACLATLVDTTTRTSACSRIHDEVTVAIGSALSLCDGTAAGVARNTGGLLLGNHGGDRIGGRVGEVRSVVGV